MRFICSDLIPTWRLPTALAHQMLSTATSPITASSLRRYHQQSESWFRQHVCILAEIGRVDLNCLKLPLRSTQAHQDKVERFDWTGAPAMFAQRTSAHWMSRAR